jgi:Domain of unknown function DUF11
MPVDQRSRGRLLRPLLAVVALTAVATALAPAASAVPGPPMADLTVTASPSPTDEVSTAGGIVTVHVSIRNAGQAAANDATAAITLPPGAALATDTIYAAYWQCDVTTTPTFTCVHPSLEPDQAADTLSFPVRLPAGAEGTRAAIKIAVSTTSQEAFTANNSAKVTLRYVVPRPPDLAVGMTIVPSDVIVGGTIYFNVDVQNIGAGTATYAFVEVVVPANVDPASSGGPEWNCNFGRDLETGMRYWGCSYGPLSAGEAAPTITLAGTVTSGAAGDTVPFTATARPAELEENLANNAATASVAVVAAGTIRGIVWFDRDANGQRSADEQGASSGSYAVEKILFLPQSPAPGDPQFIETNVDWYGQYAVALKPGPYIVQVWINDDYFGFTTPNVGDDATDSDIITVETDIYRTIGSTATIDVVGGADIPVDAGLIYLT